MDDNTVYLVYRTDYSDAEPQLEYSASSKELAEKFIEKVSTDRDAYNIVESVVDVDFQDGEESAYSYFSPIDGKYDYEKPSATLYNYGDMATEVSVCPDEDYIAIYLYAKTATEALEKGNEIRDYIFSHKNEFPKAFSKKYHLVVYNYISKELINAVEL